MISEELKYDIKYNKENIGLYLSINFHNNANRKHTYMNLGELIIRTQCPLSNKLGLPLVCRS